MLKEYYSSKELLDLGINSLPKTQQNIIAKAKRENWVTQKRHGQGGGNEYKLDSLPLPIQNEIREKYFQSLISVKEIKTQISYQAPAPAVLDAQLKELTHNQRQIADARMLLVQEVLKLERHMPRIRAIRFIVEQAKKGVLPAQVMDCISLANAKKTAARTISERVLNGWVLDYLRTDNVAERLVLLAPGQRKPDDANNISWLPQFLSHYRNTNGVNIIEAYQSFSDEWKEQYTRQPAMLEAMPSVYAVRRALKKLPPSTKNRGRLTGSALIATQLYIKRDWSKMDINTVWIGDGHNMKLKVAHPAHGRPFSPEITYSIDGKTRYVNGWSLSLSENVFAVADALRDGIEKCGLPLMYYSDKGPGETGKMLDADITGILPRLGVHHETGIAGRAQARGIIERLNKVIPPKVAKQFFTYYGPGADKDTARKMLVGVNSVSNALAQGKELTPKQAVYAGKLPSWQQLLDAIESVIDWYNNHHEHSELPKKPNGRHYTPGEYRRHLIETENIQIERLSELELRDMFRPQTTRVVQRGWISLFNYNYSADELAEFDGQDVIIGYDIHNASKVIVRKLDGTFICYALLNGHLRDAFPAPLIEKLKAKRVKGMKKRAENKIALAEAELQPVIDHHWPIGGVLIEAEPVRIKQEEPVFLFECEREAWLKKQA